MKRNISRHELTTSAWRAFFISSTCALILSVGWVIVVFRWSYEILLRLAANPPHDLGNGIYEFDNMQSVGLLIGGLILIFLGSLVIGGVAFLVRIFKISRQDVDEPPGFIHGQGC